MTTTKNNEHKERTAEKEPYEPPAVISEEVFETLALACGKSAGIQCQLGGGFTS